MAERKTKTASRNKKTMLRERPLPARQAAAPAQTKTAICLALLGRSGGATLTELQDATGWQAHSVQGFLSGIVKKRHGANLSARKPENGARRYHISKVA
jgi:hypothetical protein